MPSSITHQLIAEEALPLLPPSARGAIGRAPDEYYLGAQGPDLFFFYRIGNRSEYNLGKFLHRYRVYDTFVFFLNFMRDDALPQLREEDRDRALAYILGYLCHYAADSTFHPFVYNYMEERCCEKREHQQIENDWDVWFLRERKGLSAEKFKFAFSPETIIKDGTVARLYDRLAHALEREEVKKRRFDRGLKNFNLYLKFFHGKCYGAQKRWEKTERFFHAKRFFSRLYPRETIDPAYVDGEHFLTNSEGRGASADELFAAATKKTARLAELFLRSVEEGIPLPRAEFGNSLLTGKQCE